LKGHLSRRLYHLCLLLCSRHLVDGFPMLACQYDRASGSRCCKGEAGFSYCAAQDEKYYGFEGHVLLESGGNFNKIITLH
jgi:hypothetical protein